MTQGGTALAGVTDIEPGFAVVSVLRTDASMWRWGAGAEEYAGNFGITNIVGIGWTGGANTTGPRYLTSDGVYHNGTTNVTVNCGAL